MSNPSGWTDHGLKSIDSVLAKSIHISHRRDIFFSMKNSGKIVHCENHLDQKNCTFGLLFALGTYNAKHDFGYRPMKFKHGILREVNELKRRNAVNEIFR